MSTHLRPSTMAAQAAATFVTQARLGALAGAELERVPAVDTIDEVYAIHRCLIADADRPFGECVGFKTYAARGEDGALIVAPLFSSAVVSSGGVVPEPSVTMGEVEFGSAPRLRFCSCSHRHAVADGWRGRAGLWSTATCPRVHTKRPTWWAVSSCSSPSSCSAILPA